MRRRNSFQPVVFYNPHELAGSRQIAVERNMDGTISTLLWSIPYMRVQNGAIEQGQLGSRFMIVEAETDPVALRAAQLKADALASGATPEAIRLMGLLLPVHKQEEASMAEKLKTKTKAGATGDADALKAAAKTAPVAKPKEAKPAGEPKKKGNIEALNKAREKGAAEREQERKKKLTLVEKNNPKREGTRAFEIYALYKTCKTVGAFLDAGGTMSDVRYDSGKGFITIG